MSQALRRDKKTCTRLFPHSRTFTSFSSACCLAHWSVLLQLGYSLSAGIFIIWKSFTVLLMENLYPAIMQKGYFMILQSVLPKLVPELLVFRSSRAHNSFLCGPLRRASIFSLFFSLFSTLNLKVNKNSSWSAGRSLICISEVGICPALRSVLPISFFWELWEVLEQLTGRREADVPWCISWSVKDRAVSRLLSLLGSASIATSASASPDPDSMTAMFQVAYWLSQSTAWSWVSTAHAQPLDHVHGTNNLLST